MSFGNYNLEEFGLDRNTMEMRLQVIPQPTCNVSCNNAAVDIECSSRVLRTNNGYNVPLRRHLTYDQACKEADRIRKELNKCTDSNTLYKLSEDGGKLVKQVFGYDPDSWESFEEPYVSIPFARMFRAGMNATYRVEKIENEAYEKEQEAKAKAKAEKAQNKK